MAVPLDRKVAEVKDSAPTQKNNKNIVASLATTPEIESLKKSLNRATLELLVGADGVVTSQNVETYTRLSKLALGE